MSKKTVVTFINEATQLLKADRTNITSSKDIVNQLAWLLFLKCLEIPECDRQHMEIPAPYKRDAWRYPWAEWVPRTLKQRTSDFEECLRFFQKEFHPQLEELFKLKITYMQINTNFTTFQHLLRLIDETKFIGEAGEDCIAQLYSALFALLTEENKKLGIFATPPAITRFMVQVLDPGSQDTVYDPACGTGDFLIAADKHCIKKNDPVNTNNLFGRDSAEQIIQLARMNMLLHGIDSEQAQQQEIEHAPDQGFLSTFYSSVPDASVMLMHPPLGGYSSSVKASSSKQSFDCYEAWFLQHSWRKMQKQPAYARCGMVVSSMLLDGVKSQQRAQMRKEFLQDWNILMVVWLPKIAFSLKSSEQIYLIFFDNRPITGKILHYNLAARRGHKPYTNLEPIQDADFAEVLETWALWKQHLATPEEVQRPAQTAYQWVVTYDPQLLHQRSADYPYTLLQLPLYQPAKHELVNSDELLKQIQENHLQQQQHIQRIQELLSDRNEKRNKG